VNPYLVNQNRTRKRVDMDISPGQRKKDATVTAPDREGSGEEWQGTRQENARFRVSRLKAAAACSSFLVSNESAYAHNDPTTYRTS
jgi:hypothetical protein